MHFVAFFHTNTKGLQSYTKEIKGGINTLQKCSLSTLSFAFSTTNPKQETRIPYTNTHARAHTHTHTHIIRKTQPKSHSANHPFELPVCIDNETKVGYRVKNAKDWTLRKKEKSYSQQKDRSIPREFSLVFRPLFLFFPSYADRIETTEKKNVVENGVHVGLCFSTYVLPKSVDTPVLRCDFVTCFLL